MPRIEIIGVYPVEADEPVHLIEVRVHDADGIFGIEEFTQECPGQSRSAWQVPWMEQILNASGDEIIAADHEASRRPELWRGDVRMVFFFHYLDFERPLLTPFKARRLPPESKFPGRLAMVEFEPP